MKIGEIVDEAALLIEESAGESRELCVQYDSDFHGCQSRKPFFIQG